MLLYPHSIKSAGSTVAASSPPHYRRIVGALADARANKRIWIRMTELSGGFCAMQVRFKWRSVIQTPNNYRVARCRVKR